MAAISQQLADITVLSIVVRILLSTFCAGTLGFERERHNQAAGFRTYIIVSDASALVMMTNIFVAGLGETDLVRMSASVITGLGFLGAGTILVTRNQEVRGLTTAAGLWAVAIIGTAFGAGFYAGGIICYAFIFLAMQVLRRVDLRIRKTQRVSTVYFEMEKKEHSRPDHPPDKGPRTLHLGPEPLQRDAGEERRPRVRHVHPLGERQNDAGRGDPGA